MVHLSGSLERPGIWNSSLSDCWPVTTVGLPGIDARPPTNYWTKALLSEGPNPDREPTQHDQVISTTAKNVPPMDRLVHYHHPCDDTFSLTYNAASAADLTEPECEADGETKLIGYPFDTPVYVLYEGTEAAETAGDLQYDPDWLKDRLSDSSRATQVTAFRLIELLEAAVQVKEADEFRLYKDFEPDQIHRALENVSWGASLPVVAGELMSNLVLRHALPNANHRTSIAMLQFCVECIDPEFEMPSTHVDDATWTEWVDPYIVESKRLITVRRNNVRFERLRELGVDLVERKGGIRIRLRDYDLDMHWREALSLYAERHEDHCIRFAREILQRSERADLEEESGPTRNQFVEYLDAGVVERDFRELF